MRARLAAKSANLASLKQCPASLGVVYTFRGYHQSISSSAMMVRKHYSDCFPSENSGKISSMIRKERRGFSAQATAKQPELSENTSDNSNSNSNSSESNIAGDIDEDLLFRQEDPAVLRQKQELLKAFCAQLSKLLNEFDREGPNSRVYLKFFLKKVYGCSTFEIKCWCAMFGIHEFTKLRDVPPLFWAVLILQLNKQPRFGAENVLIEAQRIRQMIEDRSWRGLRHFRALPVKTKRVDGKVVAKKLNAKRAIRLGFPSKPFKKSSKKK